MCTRYANLKKVTENAQNNSKNKTLNNSFRIKKELAILIKNF